jgi:tRNA-specific 2-thiouridylase
VGRCKDKVAVALSGGVDSSLTALMLKEQGHQVVGLSLKLGQGPDLAWQAGAKVATELDVPHVVVDAAADFKHWVVDPAIEAYATGRTPNPCARCNARVKFPKLWQAAQEAGCNRLATGHYARLVPKAHGLALEEGVDPGKSQAYFLARLKSAQLGPLAFPLGDLTKAQVRQKAAEAGLSAADSSESQDACFLPPGGWDQIVTLAGAVRPGKLVDEGGRELGRHGGLHRFTVGQRRGLGVALGSPHYVLALDGPKAEVTVGPGESLLASGLKGSSPVWHEEVTAQMDLTVRLRYTHPGAPCRVVSQGRRDEKIDGQAAAEAEADRAAGSGRLGQTGETEITVEFETPQKAIAPGQLAVFYRGARVVGSAWITKSIKHTDGS